ncbi:MAG: GTPase domain-containing protein, partial [Streptomycetaceae bacterium]|nr:GTPase domain-containing protein [Streptomycetaceae bacterium]
MTYGAAKAPLLAVIGGPTGAGKSTLLNSLVRAPVSAAGVLRPTTRTPVLVCNPYDSASVDRHGLRPICAPLMPEGIAVIDAPNIDSIEESNRSTADELFATADLWLFVTTATRYADAAAWRHLHAARARRVALAIVLDRVQPDMAPDIIRHLRDLLGPPEPPIFVVPESELDRQGMLTERQVAPLREWLAAVVAGPPAATEPPVVGRAHVAAPITAAPMDTAP